MSKTLFSEIVVLWCILPQSTFYSECAAARSKKYLDGCQQAVTTTTTVFYSEYSVGLIVSI